MMLCCNVTKAETKYSKINGSLKNVFSIKVAVKPRDYKACSHGRGDDRGYLERVE